MVFPLSLGGEGRREAGVALSGDSLALVIPARTHSPQPADTTSSTNRMDGTTQARRGRIGQPELAFTNPKSTRTGSKKHSLLVPQRPARGTKEFIVIDANTAPASPRSIHQKLAARSRKPRARNQTRQLPFSTVEFTNAPKPIPFQAADKPGHVI